jgi:hypothetical protein
MVVRRRDRRRDSGEDDEADRQRQMSTQVMVSSEMCAMEQGVNSIALLHCVQSIHSHDHNYIHLPSPGPSPSRRPGHAGSAHGK